MAGITNQNKEIINNGRKENTSAPACGEETTNPNILLALRTAEGGTMMRRLKLGKLSNEFIIKLNCDHSVIYYKPKRGCLTYRIRHVKISDVLEIRSGWKTDVFYKVASKKWFNDSVNENRCFSIIFRKRHYLTKSVDLVADSIDARSAWVVSIKFLIDAIKKEALHFNEDRWLKKKFQEADHNKNGLLSFNEIYSLLDNLNLEISYFHAKLMFKEANKLSITDEKGKNTLDYEEFKLFFKNLTKRTDLLSIMRRFSSDNNVYWTLVELQKFLVAQKLDSISLEECQNLLQQFEPEENNKLQMIFSCQGFRKLLLSKEYGSTYELSKSCIYQDMTRPLTQYFIKSSHNTYLCGNQLQGASTVEGYINALKNGYKLLELDVWSGAKEPIITHGLTLVAPIFLRDVAKAIDHYAFCVSPYPVILSVENHCSENQQVLMASIFTETFKEKLFLFAGDVVPRLSDFPSPESLKGKILIKTKINPYRNLQASIISPPLNEYVGCVVPETFSDFDMECYDCYEDDDFLNMDNQQISEQNQPLADESINHDPQILKPITKVEVISDLTEITALANVKVKDIKVDLNTHPINGFATFVEKKLIHLEEKEGPHSVQAYTRRHFIKTYPSGLRFKSSNYDPVKFWNLGAQAVSLNAQTADEAIDLNEAMFLNNGNCGYVLKPDILSKDTSSCNMSRQVMTVFTIKVISGHYLPKPATNPPLIDDIVDPFVTITIHGFESCCQQFKTKKINNNGFNPVWDETFIFKLKYPELAFVRFLVEDFDLTSSNDFIGEFSLPITLLKEGYSHVRLRTGFRHHTDPTAVLFVHVKISDE